MQYSLRKIIDYSNQAATYPPSQTTTATTKKTTKQQQQQKQQPSQMTMYIIYIWINLLIIDKVFKWY